MASRGRLRRLRRVLDEDEEPGMSTSKDAQEEETKTPTDTPRSVELSTTPSEPKKPLRRLRKPILKEAFPETKKEPPRSRFGMENSDEDDEVPSLPMPRQRRPVRKAAAAAAQKLKLTKTLEIMESADQDDGDEEAMPVRSRIYRQRSSGLGDSDAEPDDEPGVPDRRQGQIPTQRARSSFDDLGNSDAEDSDGDEALSKSISFVSAGGSAAVRRGGGKRRRVNDLGTDDDAEVADWKKDLEDRWLAATDARPIAAFSKAPLGAEAMRKLPPENYLADFAIFDSAGKVNIPLLLGAHKSLLIALNNGTGGSMPTSAAARQIGWLARTAKTLGLIEENELKNGRAPKSKSSGKADGWSAPDLLVPDQQIRFPVKPSSRTRLEPESTQGGDSQEKPGSDDDKDDEIERFKRRKQALAALKSRTDGRQAQIGARTSHDVNMREMKEKLVAPSLSFDLSERRNEDDESADEEEGLEVSVPQEQSRRDNRRSLLKEQLQKKLRLAMAKGLVPEPANRDPLAASLEDSKPAAPSDEAVKLAASTTLAASLAASATSTTLTATITSATATVAELIEAPARGIAAETLELEIEGEDEQTIQNAENGDEDPPASAVRERRRRRKIVLEEEPDEAFEHESSQTVPDSVNQTEAPNENENSPSKISPKKQKQVRLTDIFLGKKLQECASVEDVAAKQRSAQPQQQQQQQGMPHESSAQRPVTLPVEEVAQQPRPLKRLRPCQDAAVDEKITSEAFEDGDDSEEEERLMEKEIAEEYENAVDEDLGEEADLSEDEDEDEFEEENLDYRLTEEELRILRKKRKALTKRKRIEAVQAKRRLQWEIEDAEELQTANDRLIHLGQSTMSSEDRECFSRIIHGSSLSVASAVTESRHSNKRLFGGEIDDDEHAQLYGSFKGTSSRKSSLLKSASATRNSGS